MRRAINWKIFLILLTACVAATLLVLPYAIALSPELAAVFTPSIVAAQLVQALIMFSIVIFLGLFLARRVGFGLPVLECVIDGKRPGINLKSMLTTSIGMGVLATILIILVSCAFMRISRVLFDVERSIPAWKALLASFYGGIAEEVLCRLFLMTLFVWISSLLKRTREGRPTTIGVWLSNVAAAVLFGLGHLPVTADLIPISAAVVARAILLSGIAGIIFGWLYQRNGLESAMIGHFSCDITLHGVFPIVASYFM